jgi:putative flippase GtrA
MLHFSRYAIVGLATNASLYVVFLLVLHAGLSPLLSAGLCYGVGVIMSYVLNRRWTFASGDGHRSDLPKFLFAYAMGLLATLLFITLLVRLLPQELAQFVNIGLTALVIYGCLRMVGFGGKLASDAP